MRTDPAHPRRPGPRTPVLGVTGGIGAGKSTFARVLGELGARVIDADALARSLMDSDKAIRCALREAFGEDVIDASGCLVRETLAERAFRNADSLRTLNRIVWPGLIRALRESISAMQRDGTGIPIVVDMAVLY